MSIDEALIDNQTPWWRQHWKTIDQNYRTAPYFDRYADFFETVYNTRWERLVDLDLKIIRYCAAELKINTQIILASEQDLEGQYINACDGDTSPTGRIVFLCKELGADAFLEGAIGQLYVDADRMQQNGLQLTFHDYNHPIYPQAIQGFIPYMSIIDLLFCNGPDSLGILTNNRQLLSHDGGCK